jgi:hypothetical protein
MVAGQRVELGGSEGLDHLTMFRREVMTATRQLTRCDRRHWPKYLQILLDLIELVDVGPGGDPLEITKSYLVQYLNCQTIVEVWEDVRLDASIKVKDGIGGQWRIVSNGQP